MNTLETLQAIQDGVDWLVEEVLKHFSKSDFSKEDQHAVFA